MAGASARPADEGDSPGPGMNIIAFKTLQNCETVVQAEQSMLAQPLSGKGCVQMLADANGDSRLLELVHGREAVSLQRPDRRTWDAATNFYVSGRTPAAIIMPGTYDAHARYGRIVQQLMMNPVSHSVAGAQTLLGDISQPGRYIPETGRPVQTAYASVFELANRTCHFCPGNPSRLPFERITI
jgi:hypothetical protein